MGLTITYHHLSINWWWFCRSAVSFCGYTAKDSLWMSSRKKCLTLNRNISKSWRVFVWNKFHRKKCQRKCQVFKQKRLWHVLRVQHVCVCVCVCLFIFWAGIQAHLKNKKTGTKNHPIPRHPGPPAEVWYDLTPQHIPKVWMSKESVFVYLPTWMVDFYEINVGKYIPVPWMVWVWKCVCSKSLHRMVAHLESGRPYCQGRFWCFGTNLQRGIWTWTARCVGTRVGWFKWFNLDLPLPVRVTTRILSHF